MNQAKEHEFEREIVTRLIKVDNVFNNKVASRDAQL